jgi:hypothetical protein
LTSIFMIGTSVVALTALDELTIPLPDPQPEFRQYRRKDRVGDMTMKGRGPQTIIWGFPLPTVEQVAQINAFQSDDPIYIQSPNKEDVDTVYEALINVPDPREDGNHRAGFRGYRDGFDVEFIVVSEVGAS